MLPSPLTRKARKAVARSHSIDQQLDEARERRQRELQLLILGSAGTGKSTFLKQLRIVHGDGFPPEERARAVPAIVDNTCEAVCTVINQMQHLGLSFDDQDIQEKVDQLQQSLVCSRPVGGGNSVTATLNTAESLQLVTKLWACPAVQECFKRRDEYELSPSDCHFLQSLDRISIPGYSPTLQDLVFIRKPTIGIQEYTFQHNQLHYRVIDVAGQRNHRKKWLHLFDCVTAITFFASLTSFCETLEEDPNTNALHDSLQLFQELVNNKFLQQTAFILFLNKIDLLDSKLKKHKLSECFPNYTGKNDVSSCVEFITTEFVRRKPGDRPLSTHTSCAVDMQLMRTLIKEVMDVVIANNLRKVKAF